MKVSAGTKFYRFVYWFCVLAVSWVMVDRARDAIFLAGADSLAARIWFLGFAFLAFNTAYLFTVSIMSLIVPTGHCPEREDGRKQAVSVIYPVRNEKHFLKERIDFTLSGNVSEITDLWILSDSDDPACVAYEEEITGKLREKYGGIVKYRRREKPAGRKQGNIREWLKRHAACDYFYVCDADSTVPEGVVGRLVNKARHAANSDVAIFQAKIRIVNAKTYFARLHGLGAEISQRLYFTLHQSLFSRQISFGHNCLVRTEAFKRLRSFNHVLSHDIWETCALGAAGWRTVFCPDVSANDEAPANYLVQRGRDFRWARGTLESWPLLFARGVRFTDRYYVFLGIYSYVSQFVFLVWIVTGTLAILPGVGVFLPFLTNFSGNGIYVNRSMVNLLLFTLAVVFFHKFSVSRSLRDMALCLEEMVCSTLVSLNNVLYQSFDMIRMFGSGKSWRPVSKNPYGCLSLAEAARVLWPGTVIGVLTVYALHRGLPYSWIILLPVLVSLIFSVPVVFISSKVKERRGI